MTPDEIRQDREAGTPWPLGFYAPGTYMCVCVKCGKQHMADKRAKHCLECAVMAIIAANAAPQERVAELEAALRASVEYMQFKKTECGEPYPLERALAALEKHRD